MPRKPSGCQAAREYSRGCTQGCLITLYAGNVRRSFRLVLAAAGLNSADWTPRELRHSFVSLMSDAGVPIEKIARLVGHTGTTTTETVYRKQIRPVVMGGAEAMDSLFPRRETDA